MLTPVRAASNASLSSQGQTVAVSTDGLVRAASTVAPVHQIQGADLNSSVAGKLNILLLAVRARMVDALLDVLNATSEALSIPREDDETDLAFASRLATAIQKLPPAKIEQVERQLAMQGHTMPLRVLAEALRNPAGPEAARIATYLESLLYKDRDLATRAVVRSYGQNDASPPRHEQRGEISIHRDSLAGAVRTPAVTKQGSDVPREGTELPTSADPAADQPAQIAKAAANGERVIAAPAEVKAEEPSATPSHDLGDAPQANDTADPTHETAQADTPRGGSKGDPIIPKSWPAIPASLSSDTTKLIVAIIQDQESETLLEAAAPDPAVDIDLVLEEAALADLPEGMADRSALPEGAARQSPLAAAQPPSTETAAAIARKHAASEAAMPLVAPQAIDETYAPVLMKIVEGVPFAMQPYEFSKDEADDGGARSMYREDHHGGEHSEEDPDQQGDPSQDDQTDAFMDDEAAAALAAREAQIKAGTPPHRSSPALPKPGIADEAYALYRRKVDWE